jgi:Zn-dependent oligopeptidase
VSGYTKRTTEDGKEVYDVTYKTPDIIPVVCLWLVFRFTLLDHDYQFKQAESVETRKRASEGYESRLLVNIPLLDKALELRRKIADLLGYKTW